MSICIFEIKNNCEKKFSQQVLFLGTIFAMLSLSQDIVT